MACLRPWPPLQAFLGLLLTSMAGPTASPSVLAALVGKSQALLSPLGFDGSSDPRMAAGGWGFLVPAMAGPWPLAGS